MSDCKGTIKFSAFSDDGDDDVTYYIYSFYIKQNKIKMKNGAKKKVVATAVYKQMPKFIEKLRTTMKLMAED